MTSNCYEIVKDGKTIHLFHCGLGRKITRTELIAWFTERLDDNDYITLVLNEA